LKVKPDENRYKAGKGRPLYTHFLRLKDRSQTRWSIWILLWLAGLSLANFWKRKVGRSICVAIP